MQHARQVESFTAPRTQHWYTCRKLDRWFYFAVIFRGTGLNFGNDPFATVGEGGDTDEEKEEAAEEEGLERGYRMKGRK